MAKSIINPLGAEFKGVTVTRVGLVFTERLSREDMLALFEAIGAYLISPSRWTVGDWLLEVDSHHGTMYDEAEAITGFAYGTLTNLKYVAGKFDFSRRKENLSWSHHAAVAGQPPEMADQLLDWCLEVEPRRSARVVRARVQETENAHVVTEQMPRTVRLVTETSPLPMPAFTPREVVSPLGTSRGPVHPPPRDVVPRVAPAPHPDPADEPHKSEQYRKAEFALSVLDSDEQANLISEGFRTHLDFNEQLGVVSEWYDDLPDAQRQALFGHLTGPRSGRRH